MNLGKEKIKEFVEEKADIVADKIERTPQQKLFVFFLVVISVTAVVLGYLQFKRTLDEPFLSEYIKIRRAELQQRYNPEEISDDQVSEQQRIIALQNKDSDLDGLTDYSEIYIYQTNAYLEDTDLDGISDKDEVIAGTDPSCAEGEDCTVQEGGAPATSGQTQSGSGNQLGNIDIGASSPEELQQLQERVFSGEISLDELGINNPALQQFLDQYAKLNPDSADTLTDEERAAIESELGSLSADEIRAQLTALGVDSELLAQFDDETLVETFSQTLQGLE